jgi:hypothetical protein
MAPPQPLGHLKYPDISKSNTFDNSFYGTSGHSLVKSVVITATHQETGWYGKSTRWYDIEMLDYRNSLKKVQRRHVDFYHLLHVLIKKYSNRFILCPFPAQTTSTLLGGEDNNSVALQKWLQFVCAHFHCELVNQWLIQQSLNLEGPQDEGLFKRAGSLVSWMFSGVLPQENKTQYDFQVRDPINIRYNNLVKVNKELSTALEVFEGRKHSVAKVERILESLGRPPTHKLENGGSGDSNDGLKLENLTRIK